MKLGQGCAFEERSMPANARLALGLGVDLNFATGVELESLPRIGPVLARRIVEDRQRRGPFRSVEDLARVRGIGPATVRGLRSLAEVPTVGTPDRGFDAGGF
jgi:competence protein ComEA